MRALTTGTTGAGARRRTLVFASLVTALLFTAAVQTARAQDRGLLYAIDVKGEITAAAERDLASGLAEARAKRARVVLVRLDTPGGAVASTREMVKNIARAPMPVVVYVAPSGASASSAGVFLTLSADVAAMAPQTNIGSATPIGVSEFGAEDLKGDIGRKAKNDAAAFGRALAESHGRNVGLVDRMVRKAINVTAAVAKRKGLIDMVVGSERALLQRLDGFRLKGPKSGVLDTNGLEVVRWKPVESANTAVGEPDDDGGLFGISPVLLAAIAVVVAALVIALRERST